MLILAIETATERSSIALVKGNSLLASWQDHTSHDLCRRLAAEVGAVLVTGGVASSQLDLVAIGLGPGSFTSLRIGLATAKAIALAHDLPLAGVSSLAAMAWQARTRFEGLLCPVLDARRGDLYAAVYLAGESGIERIEAEFAVKPELLAGRLTGRYDAVTVFGQMDEATAGLIQRNAGDRVTVWPESVLPDALAVAELGRRRCDLVGGDDVASLRPIYVRMSYAEEHLDLDLGLR